MAGTERTEQRRQTYKNRSLTADEFRRRREEASVEIRKVKREESLNKKRFGAEKQLTVESSDDEDISTSLLSSNNELNSLLAVMVSKVNSSVLEAQLEGATEFRKVLSKERTPPIDQVIQTGIVPRLMQLLTGPQFTSQGNFGEEETRRLYDKLQFETAWAITNIASGNSRQTWTVVQHDGIPVFIRLLSSHSSEIQEQAIWALGNIAGDSPTCRDMALNGGIMDPLLHILEASMAQNMANISLVRNATWLLSNLCRGKPVPNWTIVSRSLSFLSSLIHSNDREVIADALWSLSYLSDGSNSQIDDVIRSGVVPRVIQLLNYSHTSVQTPALRTIGNIVTGNDEQTQVALNGGVLPALASLLCSSRNSIVKEACWTISNITAGNAAQIQTVIDAGLIPRLIQVMSTGEFRCRKEACWGLSNATSAKATNPDQVHYLVASGCIKPMCDILQSQDNRIIVVALDALDAILEIGESVRYLNAEMVNNYALMIEEAGGMDAIFALQAHENVEIYQKSKAILDKYFAEEEDLAIDSSVNPSTGSFSFSASSQMPQGGFSF